MELFDSEETSISSALTEGAFKQMLEKLSRSTSNNVEMLLLPVLTAASGMMGTSVVRTHSDKNFKEKNILWTCTAAATGKLSSHIRCNAIYSLNAHAN